MNASNEVRRILIVDDEPSGRRALESMLLRQNYDLAFAAGGREALDLARRFDPDLILLDVMMPGMDGRECLSHLRFDPRLAEIPVILVSALDDRSSRVAGLEAGADGYVAKPFDRAELRAQIRTILRLNRYRKLHRTLDLLHQAYDETLDGWVRAMDLREHELEGHSQRVTTGTLELARFLGVDDRELVHIRRGALLHDVGKLVIPDSILRKPGPLTSEEWTIMRQHPELARSLLEPIAYLQPAIDIPFCHHERWDGQGYPRGLSGEQIPRAARIFSVIDVWDALISDRPYRKAWPVDRVRDYIRDNSGSAFDPDIASAFLALSDAWERGEVDCASEERPILRVTIPPEPSTDQDEGRYGLAPCAPEVSLSA
jgi:putative two-component system response regulator